MLVVRSVAGLSVFYDALETVLLRDFKVPPTTTTTTRTPPSTLSSSLYHALSVGLCFVFPRQ